MLFLDSGLHVQSALCACWHLHVITSTTHRPLTVMLEIHHRLSLYLIDSTSPFPTRLQASASLCSISCINLWSDHHIFYLLQRFAGQTSNSLMIRFPTDTNRFGLGIDFIVSPSFIPSLIHIVWRSIPTQIRCRDWRTLAWFSPPPSSILYRFFAFPLSRFQLAQVTPLLIVLIYTVSFLMEF